MKHFSLPLFVTVQNPSLDSLAPGGASQGRVVRGWWLGGLRPPSHHPRTTPGVAACGGEKT